jgi:hypothetical protein
MIHCAHFTNFAPVLQGKKKQLHGWVVGFSAIIEKLNLQIPHPLIKALISEKNQSIETEAWKIFPKRYLNRLTEYPCLPLAYVSRIFRNLCRPLFQNMRV